MGVFVGRHRELEALERSVRADGPGIALVVGDPGSGKSRLLAEASDRIHVPHRFRIAGFEAEQQVPLAAASPLLRELAAVPGEGERLDALLFQADGASGSALEPLRVFEAAHRTLREQQPALLVVDDLQWVDGLSLALVHYLARAAEEAGQQVVVIAASRRSTNAVSFATALAGATKVELDGLGRKEGVALVRALSPELTSTQAADLWQKAGGFPFWLEALALSADAEADAGRLVTQRLSGASADATELFSVLVVGTRPLGLADAAEIEGWPLERAEGAAMELVTHGVAVESAGVVRLAHDLIRAAAMTDLPLESRRRIHRRLAEWLERAAGSDLQSLRHALEHRRAAGLPTLALAFRVARSPHRRLLGRDGLVQLAEIADEGNPEEAFELQEAVAELAAETAEHALALQRFQIVAEQASETFGRAHAFLRASHAATQLTNADEARTLLDAARHEAVRAAAFNVELDAHEAHLLLSLEHDLDAGGRAARRALRGARALLREVGSVNRLSPDARRAYLAAVSAEHHAVMMRDDDLGILLGLADESASVAQGFEDEAYLDALVGKGRTLLWLGRAREAETALRQAWDGARRRVLPPVTVRAGRIFAGCLLERGMLDQAGAVAAEVVEVAERTATGTETALPLTTLGTIALARDDWREAVKAFEASTEALPDPHHRVPPRGVLATWRARVEGERAAAEVAAQIQAAIDDAVAADCRRCRIATVLGASDALARVGRPAEARGYLAEWDAAHPHPVWIDAMWRERAGAVLEAKSGDPVHALGILSEARAEAERRGFAMEDLWTRLDIGRTLAVVDRDRAVEELHKAAAAAAALGVSTVEKLALRELRALGVRTWRAGPASGAAAMSEREAQVAQLVAQGASNPEIAESLFVSRKTIERHVSNLLRKLDVRNRAELAAKVRELERDMEGAPR